MNMDGWHMVIAIWCPFWFDGDCMPKVLVDIDDLPDFEESDYDYEKDFVINNNDQRSL